MTAGFSIYLNVIRFVAAMVVFLSHYAYPRFADESWAWMREYNLGAHAVIVFFVLSGLVIAFTADQKDRAVGDFAFARATRIFSVAIPALIIGFALDRWGASLSPADYTGRQYYALSLEKMLLRGLTFTNEWGQWPVRLGTNGPYWSLSYEVAYYALFAVAFYMRGAMRLIILGVGCLLVGVNIMLLLPTWLVGVVLYNLLKSKANVSRSVVLSCAIGPIVVYAVAVSVELPTYLTQQTQQIFADHNFRFSNQFAWKYFLAICVVTHLFGMAKLLSNQSLKFITKPAAWLAGASFSIYLVHYPILEFVNAAFPQLSGRGIFWITLTACFVFASLFERPLHVWRDLFHRAFGWMPEAHDILSRPRVGHKQYPSIYSAQLPSQRQQTYPLI